MSNPLRNPAINYGDGWFFVTAQVAHNKSQFGVIAGGRCELNELGRRVVACWEDCSSAIRRPGVTPGS